MRSLSYRIVGGLFFMLAVAPPSLAHDQPDPITALDRNGDGRFDPYEALEVLVMLERAADGTGVTLDNIVALRVEQRKRELEDIAQLLADMDADGDGRMALSEMSGEWGAFGPAMDADDDGFVTAAEMHAFDFAGDFFQSPAEINAEVENTFGGLDANSDGRLTRNEVEDDAGWRGLAEGDRDRDGKVSRDEMTTFLTTYNTPARFTVSGDTAYMSGVINGDTPARVLRLIFEHPSVTTIEMVHVPGSIDDEANLRAAAYVRDHGFTTILRSTSSVSSGGTDFFLAGATRVVEKGAKLGIHSWGWPGFEGRDVPRDNPQHQLYLTYYDRMGIPAAFYWRTLEAAPADGIHWMTEDEISTYNVRNGP